MTFSQSISNFTAALALTSLVAVPALADRDKGNRGKDDNSSKSSSHWNSAPPKKNGRHDNRNWNKDRGDRYDDRNYDNGRYDDLNSNDDYWYNDNNRSNDGYRNNDDYYLGNLSDRRQQTKNEWRNIALLSGGVTLLGLLQKDNRLVFAGAAGALYSLYRYEQDRKSQSQVDRLRASYFGRDYFVRDGSRYNRRLVSRNGEQYYQFVRG